MSHTSTNRLLVLALVLVLTLHNTGSTLSLFPRHIPFLYCFPLGIFPPSLFSSLLIDHRLTNVLWHQWRHAQYVLNEELAHQLDRDFSEQQGLSEIALRTDTGHAFPKKIEKPLPLSLPHDGHGIDRHGHRVDDPCAQAARPKLVSKGIVASTFVRSARLFGEISRGEHFSHTFCSDFASDHGSVDAFAGQRVHMASRVADEEHLSAVGLTSRDASWEG